MRIVFMGTPEAALPALQRCLDDRHEIVAVWTQPDRPAGRHNRIQPSPVKALANSRGLAVYQPARLKSDETKTLFASHGADLAVVVAYGSILPLEYLRAPRRGCINAHFSLLPLYRGAAPVNWAIINGERKTGVTTMFIEQELDSGPILLQRETDIGEKETACGLMARLSEMGATLLSETLSRLSTVTPQPQRDRDATYAPVLQKSDGLIRWSNDAPAIERCVRGLQPWPNAFTGFRSRRLIVWRAEPIAGGSPAPPGEVVVARGDDLIIRCGEETSLRLIEVQPEGARRMSSRDFVNGGHVQSGEKLG